MNRKLINGLLLLTVSACGIGTFTSCKDDDGQYATQQETADLIKLLDEKIGQGDENLEVVRKKLNDLIGAGLLTEENQDYLKDLIQNNKNYAEQLKVYVDDLVMSLITSVEIEEVYNPAFGTVNLPIGIQSTLLCNYYYYSKYAVKFPHLDDNGLVCTGESGKTAYEDFDNANITVKGKGDIDIPALEYQDIDNLGIIYVTVNPSTIPESAIDKLTVRLVKSNGETVLGELEKLEKEDKHVINFGYTRSGNGFYKIKVNAKAEDVSSIAISPDKNALTSALKDLANNPTKTDFAKLAETLYRQFNNNKVPALALELSVPVPTTFTYQTTPWNPTPGGIVFSNVVNNNGVYETTDGSSQTGNKGTAEGVSDTNYDNPILRSVYSGYKIAAVTYHPLGYSSDPEDYIPSKRLPEIGHIQQYVNRVFDKLSFDLGLTGVDPEKYNFTLDLSEVNFEIGEEKIEINLGGTPVYKTDSYDEEGNLKDNEKPIGFLGEEANIVLGYDPNAADTPVKSDYTNALNGLVNAIVDAVNGDGTEGSGFKGEIAEAVNEQLIDELDKMIADLNSQITGIQNKVDDTIENIKDRVNAELNGLLGDGVNRLIDLYNVLAKKINAFLDSPNDYLQVYAAYKDVNGDLHQFSSVASDPSIFTPGNGNAIEMFLTSYNAELLAPAYKKYVAVVKASDGSDVSAINANATYLNTVLEGRQQRTDIPVGGANGLKSGVTYTVFYAALDYRGYVSARNFYIRVK